MSRDRSVTDIRQSLWSTYNRVTFPQKPSSAAVPVKRRWQAGNIVPCIAIGNAKLSMLSYGNVERGGMLREVCDHPCCAMSFNARIPLDLQA